MSLNTPVFHFCKEQLLLVFVLDLRRDVRVPQKVDDHPEDLGVSVQKHSAVYFLNSIFAVELRAEP